MSGLERITSKTISLHRLSMKQLFSIRIHVCIVILCACNALAGDDSITPESKFENPKVYKAGVDRDPSGQLVAFYDLGSVSSGKVIEVILHLENRTEKSFVISSVRPSCSCTIPSFSSENLQAGGSISIGLTIKPPPRYASGDQHQFLQLETGSNSTISLGVKYSVEGVLSFKSLSSVLSVGETDQTKVFKLPFFFTKPIDLSDLTVKASDNLPLSNCSIIGKDGDYFVECSLNRGDSSASGVTGEITISDNKRKSYASISVIIIKKPPLTIMPSVIRFTRSETQEKYTASALARIDAEFLQRTEVSGRQAVFAAKSIDGVFEVESKNLAEGLFRLTFVLTPSGDAKGDSLVSDTIELSADTATHNLLLNCKLLLR